MGKRRMPLCPILLGQSVASKQENLAEPD